jgi:uncharacterized membrane protein
MSGNSFHVHGPHEHELEHASNQDHDSGVERSGHGTGGHSLTNQIAVCTAIIATVGAIFSYMGGATQANAGLFRNNAAIRKTEAGNQWNYFQSKSTKQSLAEFAGELAPETARAIYRERVQRYEKEKVEIQVTAQALDKEAADWDRQSEAQMHQHHRWAQATTALQVAIALAAMALLTRKKWLEWGMFGLAGLGLLIGGAAALHF